MRRVHRASGGRTGAGLRDARLGRRRQEGHHHQGARHAGQAASGAGRVRRRAGAAVRLLRERLDHDRSRDPEEESEGERRGAARGPLRPEMPLRHPRLDPARDQARARSDVVNRREFLQTSGALVVSSSFSFDVAAQGGKPALVPGELDSWIAVMPDGGVKAFFGKMDMGQALDIAVAQVVADELDVGFDRVQVFMGDTATSCNQGGASGSTGVSNGVRLLRRAAAEARRVLLERASEKLGVPASQLSVQDGIVNGKVSYGELVGGKYFNHAVKWNGQTGNGMDITVPAKPKPPAEYKVVGKPLPRRDVAWKVFGTGDFVTDVRVKGMLHARVIRPPSAEI